MKSRLLFVSPEFPYPPDSGGRLRTMSLLKYLAHRFEIHCVTFAESPPAQNHVEGLRAGLAEVTVLPLSIHRPTRPRRFARNMWRALRFIPPLVDRFAEPSNRRALCRLLENHAGWVWLEHLWLAPYVESIPRSVVKILDVHNVESDFYHQLRYSTRNLPWRLGYCIFERAASRIEQSHLASFDRILAVSPRDRELLARNCPLEKISVVPNAVEIGPPPAADEGRGNTVYFAGRLDYPPNREAVWWFHSQVLPLIRRKIPDLRWNIVGARPELLGKKILDDPHAVLTGPVESTAPYLRPSSLVIVPLQLGAGTRFKILEAWSAGKAVVSTPKGAEGLACRQGENIWIASTPAGFADGVTRVLLDSGLRARLGEGGWNTVKEHYSWERLHQCLDAALGAMPRN